MTNNNPPICLKIRGGVEVDSYGKKAGKGALLSENLSMTLGVSQDQYLFQPIVIDPVGGNPACNQGGIIVCQYWDGSQTAGTLTANNAGGSQRMPDKENFNCVIQMRRR